jgi:multiple sugar transport system substrate-binding protein
MEKQRKTFLSYSRLNKDFAIRLAKELKSEGFNIWLDQLDIPAGVRWDRELERALKESEIFMIILTPASVDSENVLDEIGYAIDTGKRFLPVLLEKCDVPLRLRRFQYVDFTNKNFDEGVESAKELLRSLVAQPTSPRRETPADTQAKTEADRLAVQRAEEEHLEKERARAEARQKAQEELDRREEAARLAAQEADRKEREDLEAKAETDRLAAQKAEEERAAKAKAKADRIARKKAEDERKAREQAVSAQMPVFETTTETVTSAPAKKPVSMGLIYGIIALVVLGVAGIVLSPMLRGGNPPATEVPTEAPATSVPATEAPAPTEAPGQPDASSEHVELRWFIGVGAGTSEEQVAVEQAVVDEFNSSQDRITVTIEVVDYEKAADTLAEEFASGNGPDIVGPVGWGGSYRFHGQWLDLSPYINDSGFDTSRFQAGLVEYYQTDEGQVSLPFAVFPPALYYVPHMFDESGLNYPPKVYGETYNLDGREVDWNWETLAEIARRLTVDANGKNATQDGFDPNQITQIGFGFQWGDAPQLVGSYRAGAATIVQDNQSVIPDSWREANRWYYDVMWGSQPFMATGALESSADFGNGNVFNSGKEAMTIVPSWYLCCMTDLAASGVEFQIAVLPLGDDGQVHGHIDADTFRIWNGSPHPGEAFEFLAYLLTAGSDRLLPIYVAMSAIPENNQNYFNSQAERYPFVTAESWNVLIQDLAYIDTPSADQYQPNFDAAIARMYEFSRLLKNTSPDQIDFDAEWQRLIDDLNAIYQG